MNIVLFQPEIPQNTGNIGRTCVATDTVLHLIEPLGFRLDEKSLKRAGMDYLIGFNFNYYEDYEQFLKVNNNPCIHYITRYGFKAPSEADFTNADEDIFVMFGKESTGIPKEILKADLDRCYRLPMKEDTRSLNLSNCVAIVVYEILRQQDYKSLSRYEVLKGKDFLNNC